MRCNHPKALRRTVYRGPLGGVELCERCGKAFSFDADGKATKPGFMKIG